jgi:hypothetical protein
MKTALECGFSGRSGSQRFLVFRIPKPFLIEFITASSRAIDQGKATVAGYPAEWIINLHSQAWAAFPPGQFGTASDYPTYTSLAELLVCVEELDLIASLAVGGELASVRPKDSNDLPTAERNAAVPEAREEVHADQRRRYEEYVKYMISFLETVETGGWDGRTDLSGLPTSLGRYQTLSEDPFRGELSDMISAREPRPSENGSRVPGVEENLTSEELEEFGVPSGETEQDIDDAVERFVDEYYAAVGIKDWKKTYSLLNEESRSLFTEEEWDRVQSARDEIQDDPPISTLESTTGGGPGDFVVSVTLGYADGSTETLDIRVVEENGEIKRVPSSRQHISGKRVSSTNISLLEG